MSWLCRLGLHRWEFEDDLRARWRMGRLERVEVISCRCRRGCPQHGQWAVVHVERARLQ